MILQKMEIAILFEHDLLPKFPLPFRSSDENMPFREVGMNKWMYFEHNLFFILLLEEVFDIVFDLVGNDDAWSIFPVPSHAGHCSRVSMVISGRTRCRVICTNPNLLGGRMVCFARSLAISSFSF